MAQAGERLHGLIGPAVEALGYELVGVEYLPQGRHSLLRVYIDSDEGIDVEDCERASHQVSGVLDVEDPIKGQYTLEVSSPGIERPLFTAAHFERFKGERAQVRLGTALDGRRRFTGMLRGVDGNDVLIEVDGDEYRLPLEQIEKAHLAPEW
ncbi:MAG TPA: ribosome maturation factor RimP [Gammaproteobacteria bacterium]|nr:ribosome maturation factor RimP [Gammaproteobacteria bacterium]